METPNRTLAKAFTWQVWGLAVLMIVGYLVTGSLSTGGTFAAISAVTGFISYVLHERLWSRVRWGIVRGRDAG
ncbi:MAG: DUF2061 domain-containing protein [Pseudomonadota bacterium]